VYHADTVVASSRAAYRVLETASPPSFYIPPQDVRMDLLLPKPGFSTCEWKGRATYWVLGSDPKIGKVGWSYGDPRPGFRAVRNYLSFYPTVLSCFVDGERVRGQSGGYYGGWITGDIVGPFKGDRGTGHW
jgi:uncharacterized protein (DUF427 family)